MLDFNAGHVIHCRDLTCNHCELAVQALEILTRSVFMV